MAGSAARATSAAGFLLAAVALCWFDTYSHARIARASLQPPSRPRLSGNVSLQRTGPRQTPKAANALNHTHRQKGIARVRQVDREDTTEYAYSEEAIARKSVCCNNYICGNSTTEALCSFVNGSDVGGMGTAPVAGNCDITVKRCECIWQNFTQEEMEIKAEAAVPASAVVKGFCYGYSTEHIINDTDVKNFPQESNSVSLFTLFLVGIPLGMAVCCFLCGVACSTKAYQTFMADLIWKVRPLKIQEPEEEEEEEEQVQEDSESSDDDGGGLQRAKAKARKLGEWTLDIKVLQARNLPKSDTMFIDRYLVGMADPYAVIGMRNKRRERKEPYVPEHKTETLTSTLNPEWNAQFRMQFSGTQDEISVQIWDWDKYKYDDYIGEALIPTGPLVQSFKPGQAEFSNSNWYELYDKKGQVLTAGRTGKQLDMITAVELALKLDKTYDPVEALGDMKRALKSMRQTAHDDVEAKKKEERAALAVKKRNEALEAELALNVPPEIRAQSQALEEVRAEKLPRDTYMASLPTSSHNAPGAATGSDTSSKKKKKKK